MDKKIIFGVILTVFMIICIVGARPTTAGTDVHLEEAHFKFLTISVPEESEFSLEIDQGDNLGIINHKDNKGGVFAILTRLKDADVPDGNYVFQNTTGDINIYKSDDDYRVDKVVGDYRVFIRGTNLNLIMEMLNTAKCS